MNGCRNDGAQAMRALPESHPSPTTIAERPSARWRRASHDAVLSPPGAPVPRPSRASSANHATSRRSCPLSGAAPRAVGSSSVRVPAHAASAIASAIGRHVVIVCRMGRNLARPPRRGGAVSDR